MVKDCGVNWYLYEKKFTFEDDGQKSSIISSFKNNPSYYPVTIDSSKEVIDAQILDYSGQGKKIIIIMPDKTIQAGNIVNKGTEKWLCTESEFYGEIYYRGIIQKCNSILTLQTSITKVKTGDDSLGRPIYTETAVMTSWNCVVESRLTNADFDKGINLPEGKIFITASYSSSIKENMEFSMWGNKYKITGLVFENTGVLGVWAERVVS